MQTPKVLNYLEEKNLKATFYVIGANVVNHPEILQATYIQGNEASCTVVYYYPLTELIWPLDCEPHLVR